VEIGIHTHSHKTLSRLSAAEQEHELRLCHDILHDQIGLTSPFVAYPNGIKGSWNEDTIAACARLGFRGAFVLNRQYATPSDFAGRWAISRFDVNDVFERGTGRLKLAAEQPDARNGAILRSSASVVG
jgi:peptidoglycan/xylan/chitin deacetylase (PgdA/CDA1 family)